MPVGDDWKDLTPTPDPTPKTHLYYPPPDGTGEIAWPSGMTLQAALQTGLPSGILAKRLTRDATLRIVLEVREI